MISKNHRDDVDVDAQFTGKYEDAGRVGSVLIARFYDAVRECLSPGLQAGAVVVEVGSGAGYSTKLLREFLAQECALIGSDVRPSLVSSAQARNPGVEFVQQSVYELPFADKSVDAIVMLEVLEHLEDPVRALREIARVTSGFAVISTPREPLWRLLNMARGKYLQDFGNTPGHIQHWSSRRLARLASSGFHVDAVMKPVPWTVLRLIPRL